jgi:glycosyltransferase involved in cell wall biosynthesis
VSTESPISVVIAAHNEAAVIGRCLDALLAGAAPGELDVTVVANGCTDGTAAVAASRPGVRVIDRPEPGKVGALNAGDAVAVGFPRIYLDADIVLPPGAVRALAGALGEGVHAVVPRRELDVAGRPLLVRAYYAINARMPVYDRALFGRGVIALSEAGRARFDAFPDVVADDLYLDSLFSREEKRQVDSVAARIATPRRTRDLVRRLTRVRSGNASIRASAGVRPAARSSWLRDVVLPRPWLAPAGICYAAITVVAAAKARRSPATGARWGRDESSRSSREESHADR